MTIYEIKILLHYFACRDDHPHVVENPPAWRPTIEAMQESRLLMLNSVAQQHATKRCYDLTDRGRVFCLALQELPLPVQVWKIPEVGHRD